MAVAERLRSCAGKNYYNLSESLEVERIKGIQAHIGTRTQATRFRV